uniref:Uncharacterized protein n=1 Tax=Ciona intestinalis TaxID=7719 RepID=H2XRZ4_CIOIN
VTRDIAEIEITAILLRQYRYVFDIVSKPSFARGNYVIVRSSPANDVIMRSLRLRFSTYFMGPHARLYLRKVI